MADVSWGDRQATSRIKVLAALTAFVLGTVGFLAIYGATRPDAAAPVPVAVSALPLSPSRPTLPPAPRTAPTDALRAKVRKKPFPKDGELASLRAGCANHGKPPRAMVYEGGNLPNGEQDPTIDDATAYAQGEAVARADGCAPYFDSPGTNPKFAFMAKLWFCCP